MILKSPMIPASRKFSGVILNKNYKCFRFLKNEQDCLGGVMVGLLSLSEEGPGYDPQLGQIIDIKIGFCCFLG